MSQMQTQYVVVGGGMVGTAMALGLARLDKDVVLIEAFPAPAFEPSQPPDLRMSALAQASVEFLTDLGAWQHIETMRTRPYTGLAVWEHPLARTEFHAADIGAQRLGVFVENRITQLGLGAALAQYDNCRVIHSTVLSSDAKTGRVICTDGTHIKAQTIIAADGVKSGVREAAGITTQGWHYDQQALGITIKNHYSDVESENRGQSLTWQQFMPSGPLAFLPMHEDYASLVWYDTPERINELKILAEQADKSDLHAAIRARFPNDLGEFEVLDCASFPLSRMHAVRYIKHNVILIGDAAHAINPLAGQGVNIGFQDVKCLLEVIAHEGNIVTEYEKPRQRANLQMMTAMDGFYVAFSNTNPVLKALRNIGLFGADKGGKLKHAVMKKAMGI
jgi:2-octaprenyl-3-methyl-6-methoxy-1,4-benzoquinol hydroxylase